MPALQHLVVRDDKSGSNLNPTVLNLLIALVVLVVVSICLIAGLLVFRWLKRSKKNPTYDHEPYGSDKMPSSSSNYRRLTVDTMNTTPAYAYQEKRALMESSSPPGSPLSGVPEIRITFPDEVDTTGRPQSGRVVVVRMGENNAMGLEPVGESLPPYVKEGSDRFQSLDLDRIGGLKEQDLEKRYL